MKRRVILATISLDQMGGGLERNILYLANHLSDNGYDVHLITFDQDHAQAFYEINDDVKWHKVGVSAPHTSVTFAQRLDVLKSIRKVLKDCGKDTPIVCFHHGILARFMAAKFMLGNPVICSERNSLSIYRFNRLSQYNLNFLLLYLCGAITVQFPEYIKDYPALLRRKITAISNPVFAPKALASPSQSINERYTLLTVTRLSSQKNLEQLIKSFAGLSEQYPNWDLKILGDGEYKSRLESLIQKLGVEKRVFLEGKQSDVASYYKNAHLFALPSQWEGFPNALAEALSYGLPSVGYDDCAGVNLLIKDGENGKLAKENANIETLKDALSALMQDDEIRKNMGKNAAESIKQYVPEAVFKKWEDLLAGVMR